MLIHDNCNKKLVDDCLKRIDFYKKHKNNDIFDDFYHPHLDCFESLIEDWKAEEENCYAVIMSKYIEDGGKFDPLYVTVRDMLQSGNID